MEVFMNPRGFMKRFGIIVLVFFLVNFGNENLNVRANLDQQISTINQKYLPFIRRSCDPLNQSIETTKFYRIRIDFTSTSHSSSIEFLNSTNVLTARLMQVTGSPLNPGFYWNDQGDFQLGLWNQMPGQEMGMLVDIALSEDASNQTMNFILKKEISYESTVRFYLVNGKDLILIYEIKITQPDQQMEFGVDFSMLSQYLPNQGQTYHLCPMVWAIYYGWYQEAFYPRYWTSDIWTDKPAELYSSDDPNAIARQIDQAKSAGIDGFLVEWCGLGNPGGDLIDQNFALALNVAKDNNFIIAPYYDILCTKGDVSFLSYLIQKYGNHPAYYRINGKPLIVMFNTAAVSLDEWHNKLDELRNAGLDGVFVGMGQDPIILNVFDGIHDYFNLLNFSYYNGMIGHSAPYFGLLTDDLKPKFWAATVSPGFDNTPLVRGWGVAPMYIDRQGSNLYRESFESAIASNPTWIIITSWNEFQENTHIEPRVYYDSTYLQITKEFVHRWKNH